MGQELHGDGGVNPTRRQEGDTWIKHTSSGSSFLQFAGFCRRSLWEGCSDVSASYSTLSIAYRCWKEFVSNGGVVLTDSKKGSE